MNPIEQLMALLTGQGAPQQGGYVPAQDMGAHNMPFAPQQMPTQRVSQAQPMNAPQGAPRAAQGPGLLSQLFNPRGSKQTMTENWLIKSQGYDPGTAKVIAGNKALLGQVLAKQINGPDPMAALDMEKKQLEIEKLRNPTNDDIIKYNLYVKQERAAGRQPQDFTPWLRDNKRAGAINIGPQGIDYGDPPTGYAWKRNPDKTVAIDERGAPIPLPIGEKYEKMKAAEASEDTARDTEAIEKSVVLEDISKLRQKLESEPWYNPSTGFLGSVLRDYGGTGAFDVGELSKSIRASVGFDRLQKMREASPTGGALGAISERELGLLEAALGSLNPDQSKDQFLENLERVEKIYSAVMQKAALYPNAAEYGFNLTTSSTEKPLTPDRLREWGQKNYGKSDNNDPLGIR